MCIVGYASFYKFSESSSDKTTFIHTEISAEEDLLDAPFKLHALVGCVVTVRDPVFRGDYLHPCRIYDCDIGVTAGKKRAFCRINSVQFGLILGQYTAEALR